jgi:hypothetical protein
MLHARSSLVLHITFILCLRSMYVWLSESLENFVVAPQEGRLELLNVALHVVSFLDIVS